MPKTDSSFLLPEAFYDVRSGQRQFSKFAVGLRAVALLREGESLLIDAGTSLTPVAQIVRTLSDLKPNQTHFTIMTHNNAAFGALLDTPANARFNVFQTGGRYDRDLNASFGRQAETAYLGFFPRWVFLGQNGLVAELGLFCHGNTEELALKREIFSMPAWARVVVSDFTKVGSPGGLLYGDSANLTTNVEECWLISDDIHDEKFRGTVRSRRAIEIFETQIRLLQETYGVRVELVHYTVSDLSQDSPFCSDPELRLAEGRSTKFRIHLTAEDIKSADEWRDECSLGSVDIVFRTTEKPISVKVESVDLRWNSRGEPVIAGTLLSERDRASGRIG